MQTVTQTLLSADISSFSKEVEIHLEENEERPLFKRKDKYRNKRYKQKRENGKEAMKEERREKKQ